jgi:hypothetical protein
MKPDSSVSLRCRIAGSTCPAASRWSGIGWSGRRTPAQSEGAIFLAEDRPFYPNLSKIRLGFRVTSTGRAGLAGEGAGLMPRFPATFAVAFDVRASLICLPFAVSRLRLCDRLPDRRALLPGPRSEFRFRRSPWLPLPVATLESVAGFQLQMPFPVSARVSFPIPATSPVAGSRV